MSKNYVQDGCTVEITATANITSGQAVSVGDLVAVAIDDIADTKTGVGSAEGVFNLPKVSADNIAQGAKVYLKSDGNITTTASGNKLAGKAWAAAGASTNFIDVKINV